MSRFATERNRNIISGAVGLIVLIAVITVGIKASFGEYDGGYELRGTFAAAGQGLLSGSDVKVRGVNVGEVKSIELVDNRALITMRINDDTQIPADAQAVIRPKTLFGEKFVDVIPGSAELTGPYLDDGAEITDTLGGFELEQVLSDTFPVLEAVDPAELAVILDELANAGDGLGLSVNRSIVNAATLTQLQASNDAEIRQFLGDLALLSEELDKVAPDLVSVAQDLNIALPTLNDRSDELNSALVQLGRLSSDVADLLDNNRDFTENALTNGSKALQILFERRSQIQPLLLGLQQYTQTLSEVIRVEVGDGTLMAAVKNLVSVQETSAGAGAAETNEAPGALEPILESLPATPPAVIDAAGAVGGTTDALLGLLAGGNR